tara:strand:- start:1404 stop:1901 length:498 start_codon:yes stop_codon:yes gene_type:complete
MPLAMLAKYKPVLDYITDNHPMHIVEYGGGESTYVINQHLTNLGYGGKITAFEDNLEFFNFSKEQGWNTSNSIKLTSIERVPGNEDIVRYTHTVEEIEGVDFFICDGPNYRVHLKEDGSYTGITDNIHYMITQLGRNIPFWIEGRHGTQRYMMELGYNMITDYEL